MQLCRNSHIRFRRRMQSMPTILPCIQRELTRSTSTRMEFLQMDTLINSSHSHLMQLQVVTTAISKSLSREQVLPAYGRQRLKPVDTLFYNKTSPIRFQLKL